VSSDPSYLSFVAAASYLRATTYGIEIPAWAKDAKEFRQAVDKIRLPEFLPKKGVKIETDEKATSMHSLSLDDDFQIEQLIQTLEGGEKTLPHGFHMHPISFEKVCACPSGF
jgi:ubiquitin-activating enzyme E1